MKLRLLCLITLGYALALPLAAQVSFAGPPPPLIIPQIADGGGWQTTLVLTNPSVWPATASLKFYQSTGGGSTQSWNLSFIETNSTQTLTVPAASTLFLHTPGTDATAAVGWGQVQGLEPSSPLVCYAVFTRHLTGQPDQGGAAPATLLTNHILIPFDNTNNFVTSMAIANPSSTSESISVFFQPSGGSSSQLASITLPGWGQTAFTLPQQFSATAGESGLLEFFAPGFIFSAIALRFGPSGAFTASPVYDPDSGLPIIGGSPIPASIGNLTSLLTFQPAGNPSSQIPLILTPNSNGGVIYTYGARLGSLDLINGISSNQNQTFTFDSQTGIGGFLFNGTLLQVTSASLSLTLNYDQPVSNPAYPTGTVSGALTVSAAPFRGGANVTVSGSIAGNFLIVQ